MSRVLKPLVRLCHNEDYMHRLTIIGIAISAIGGLGGGLVQWHVISWFPLVGFILAAAALLLASTQHEVLYMGTLSVTALALALFAHDTARFPGMHLQWLWLMLGVGGGFYALAVMTSDTEDYQTFYVSNEAQFAYVLRFAGVLLAIGLLAIFRSWAMFENVLIADAILFALYFLLRPRGTTWSGVPATR